jgi:hypothetical protein
VTGEEIIPELIGVAAQSIVENANRLGLTWTLRLATVIAVKGGGIVDAIYDGDTEAISMVSMIGTTYMGGRVYVIAVPPAGNYIIGYPPTYQAPRYINANATDAGTLLTTSAEAAVPSASWDAEPEFSFYSHRLYRIDIQVGVFNAAATNSVSRIRVRQGSASTSGQQLGFWQASTSTANVSSSSVASFTGQAYAKGGSQVVTTQLSLTLQRQSGAANISLYGDADMPATVAIIDVGSSEELSGLAVLATEIT